MDIRNWVILLIEPNRFEAQIIVDLLRFAGVQHVRTVPDSEEALRVLRYYQANIVLMELDCPPIEGLSWTRRLRRDGESKARKAIVMMLTKGLSRAVAENCRLAGVNSIIGKPVSGATLINTIKKVLANPRPFVEFENYVGPCRRAGIITADAPLRRRRTDAGAADKETLQSVVAEMRVHVEALRDGKKSALAACEAELHKVQQIAVTGGDGPLMRACAAFSLQLAVSARLDETGRKALDVCMQGLAKLAEPGVPPAEREAVAEGVRQIVAHAAKRAAA